MAGEEEKGEGRGFKVEDRRRFSPETGEPRETAGKGGSSESVSEGAQSGGPEENQRASRQELPEIDFSTFVISLSTQALMHLGEIPNPLTGKVESDFAVAKQMIDIIGLLRQKTRGNLDPREEKLMDDVLYDLRMRYVGSLKKG